MAAVDRKVPFIGLKNAGSTDYLNCAIQVLYQIPEIRQYYLGLPDGNDSKSVPLALKGIFTSLSTAQQGPVDTKPLRTAFGWEAREDFVQHDFTEFFLTFLETLERSLKGTPQSDLISKHFGGVTQHFIEVDSLGYKSGRQEKFYTWNVPVKGSGDLSKAINTSLASEIIDGYSVPGQGKHSARKGVRFDKLPPYLAFVLRRFDFNFETMTVVKETSVLDAPLSIDMSNYMDQKEGTFVYDLFGAVCHAGSAGGGHYYAVLHPHDAKLPYAEAPWYEFNDSQVAPFDPQHFKTAYYQANTYFMVYLNRAHAPKVVAAPAATDSAPAIPDVKSQQ